MIELRLDDGTLDLPRDFNFIFELNNPEIDFDIITGSFSFPVTLPPTSNNKRLLKHAEIIPVETRVVSFDITVFIQGVVGFRSKLVITKAGSEGFRTHVTVNGLTVEDLNKKLRELDWGDDESIFIGGSSVARATHAYDQNLLTPPEAHYVFPVWRNALFYGSANPDFHFLVNERFNNVRLHINDVVDNRPNNFYNLVPWFSTVYVLKRVFEILGFNILGSFVDDPELQQQVIYNDYALDELVELDDYFVRASNSAPEIYITASINIQFDDDSTPPNEDTEGIWDTASGQYTVTKQGEHRIKVHLELRNQNAAAVSTFWHVFVEHNFATEIASFDLTTSSNAFGIVDFDFLHTFGSSDIGTIVKVKAKDILETLPGGSTAIPTTEQDNSFIEITVEEPTAHNVYADTIDIRNHLPDITVGQFLAGQRKTFGMGVFFNNLNSEVTLNLKQEIFEKKDAKDLTEKAAERYEIEMREQGGVTMRFDFDSVDSVHPDAATHSDFIRGDGTKEVVPELTPMLMTNRAMEFAPKALLVPVRNTLGNSEAFGVGDGTFPYKTCFYRGTEVGCVTNVLDQCIGPWNYFFASSYEEDFDGNTIANYAMRFDETAAGLIPNFWLAWLDFFDSYERNERFMDLDSEDFIGNPFLDPIRVEDVLFFYEQLKFQINNKGLSPVKTRQLRLR